MYTNYFSAMMVHCIRRGQVVGVLFCTQFAGTLALVYVALWLACKLSGSFSETICVWWYTCLCYPYWPNIGPPCRLISMYDTSNAICVILGSSHPRPPLLLEVHSRARLLTSCTDLISVWWFVTACLSRRLSSTGFKGLGVKLTCMYVYTAEMVGRTLNS